MVSMLHWKEGGWIRRRPCLASRQPQQGEAESGQRQRARLGNDHCGGAQRARLGDGHCGGAQRAAEGFVARFRPPTQVIGGAGGVDHRGGVDVDRLRGEVTQVGHLGLVPKARPCGGRGPGQVHRPCVLAEQSLVLRLACEAGGADPACGADAGTGDIAREVMDREEAGERAAFRCQGIGRCRLAELDLLKRHQLKTVSPGVRPVALDGQAGETMPASPRVGDSASKQTAESFFMVLSWVREEPMPPPWTGLASPAPICMPCKLAMLVGIVGAAARTRGEERAVLRRGGQRTDVRACTLLLEWPARWRSVRHPTPRKTP